MIRFLPHFMIVLSVLGAFLWAQVWWKGYKSDLIQIGYNQAMQEVKIAQDAEVDKIRESKRRIKHEIQSMDRAAIVKQLCDSGWVRRESIQNCPD
jgi:hypothetical protein